MLDRETIGWSVFRDGSDPMIIEDLDGIVRDMNAEAERAYGFSRDELIGKPIKTLVPPDRHHRANGLRHRRRAGEAVRNIEGIRIHKAGDELPVRPGERFHMSSDGMIDQVGGARGRALGKRRIREFLAATSAESMRERRHRVLEA